MDGQAGIDLNHAALKRVLAELVAMAGLGGRFTFFQRKGARPQDEAPAERSKLSPTLPRHLYLAVLSLLRPAEAAARRLIITIACRSPAPAHQPKPPGPKPLSSFVRVGGGGVLPPGSVAAARTPGFRLLDPLRQPFRPRRPPARGGPRIWVVGYSEPSRIVVRPRPSPGDPIDATKLSHRLAALGAALDDLPRQAKRFARWRARNDSLRRQGLACRAGPLRWGRPPGGRLSEYDPTARVGRNIREVDCILAHCHALALFAQTNPDTS